MVDLFKCITTLPRGRKDELCLKIRHTLQRMLKFVDKAYLELAFQGCKGAVAHLEHIVTRESDGQVLPLFSTEAYTMQNK